VQSHACPPGPTEWRTLDRYPGILIGDDGTIVGRSGRHLKAEHGDYLVVLTRTPEGKKHLTRAHVLVCEAFHGPRPTPDHEVAHGNGVRGDDCADNLRWDTRKGNQADTLIHGTRKRKLDEATVREIREAFEAGSTQPELAKRYDISNGLLVPLLTGRIWSHVPVVPRDERRWAKRVVGGGSGEQCPTHKLTEREVIEIRKRVRAGESMYSIGPKYGVSQATIADAVHRRTWKHVP
jgi:hypothetical protein